MPKGHTEAPGQEEEGRGAGRADASGVRSKTSHAKASGQTEDPRHGQQRRALVHPRPRRRGRSRRSRHCRQLRSGQQRRDARRGSHPHTRRACSQLHNSRRSTHRWHGWEPSVPAAGRGSRQSKRPHTSGADDQRERAPQARRTTAGSGMGVKRSRADLLGHSSEGTARILAKCPRLALRFPHLAATPATSAEG